ncbi:hypothetical protein B0T17DRAFT_485333 [Bombardia bombarda]|uniref:Uncharacterized protein n=1 Tax=Bombardia bombarda TaxID=252184 RepID=A0AA40CFQ9_9PEZI|nr:hypothetical protein B0T17DRAFT_485333 [Bombardia bombarda]
MSGANSWLVRQRKSDLVELAQTVGLTNIDDLRKIDLELQLNEYLSDHSAQFQSNPKFAPYYTSRARTAGSPVKRERDAAATAISEMKPAIARPRRTAKLVEELRHTTADPEESSSSASSSPSPSSSPVAAAAAAAAAVTTSTDLIHQTPGRALSLARRIPLPATPADVAQAVDRGTLVVRERVSDLYERSRIAEARQVTRELLSTVTSVLFSVAAFELLYLRREVLPDRYAFTIPAVGWLGTADHPVSLPDMFALVTAEFWSPALTWALTSLVLPSLVGYFFNLSAASGGGGGVVASSGNGKGRPTRAAAAAAAAAAQQQEKGPEYVVDPLAFSIAKAVATYVVYAQGVTFGGLISPVAVARINSALYSGWKGVLVGTAITGLTAVYDAVLRK